MRISDWSSDVCSSDLANVDAACAQEVAAGLGDEAANQPLDATFSDYVVDGARSVSLACGKGFDRTIGRENEHAIAARKEWTEERSFQAHCHYDSGEPGTLRKSLRQDRKRDVSSTRLYGRVDTGGSSRPKQK